MESTKGMLAQQYKRALWTQLPLFMTGVWLIGSPFMLGYQDTGMIRSDIACGFLLIAFTAMALARKGAWTSWLIASVGGWLLLAPLVFWAPEAASYTNDTIAGFLVICFAVVIPYMLPMPGNAVPPGWSYNPSSWAQRLPIVILAFISFLIAHYLSAYQLGHIQAVWDPFFTPGTAAVLDSRVSRAWPVPDAGLGAVSYVLDAVAGLIGDPRRWRTMPWIVILFGIFIVPIGIVSIVLVILQPVAVGAWCTLCLVTALIAMLMIPLALDEVGASIQFLLKERREGRSLWDAFWFGGTTAGAQPEVPESVTLDDLVKSFTDVLIGPWSLMLVVLLGVALMALPPLLGLTGAAANSCYIAGPLAVTFAIIAFVPVGRLFRFVVTVIGIWVMASPWVLDGFSQSAVWVAMAMGLLMVLLSLPKGKVQQQFGMWDRYIV